jgi:hypothetical protein
MSRLVALSSPAMFGGFSTEPLYAYVMAQHFMPRQGPKPGSENALLMNGLDCELTREGEKWRFKTIVIDNAWAQGNPEILNALALHRVLSTKSKPSK